MAKYLTPAQTKAVEAAENHLKKAYAEADKILSKGGFEGKSGAELSCRICDCAHFKPPHFGSKCATFECGHAFSVHNLPI
jgi:hypothetical protein